MRRRLFPTPLALLLALALAGCGDGPSAPAQGATLDFGFQGLRPLDPATEGSYAAWAYDAAGRPHALGSFVLPPDGHVQLALPIADARRLTVTVQPPGDAGTTPAATELLNGELRGGSADLHIEGSVTAGGLPLVRQPGAHSLFTTSNNYKEGYPSEENSGLWFFRIDPQNNVHGTREVHVTPLEPGWIYEGWAVHDWGKPDAVWISFGKFRPDERQLLTSRDNTGSGPNSGDPDFRNGGVEDVPGEEWTTPNAAYSFPAGMKLPLQLDSVDASGQAMWHMVITIEPASDETEPLRTEKPFLLQPYQDPIGAGPPQQPRTILFQDNLPTVHVTTVR